MSQFEQALKQVGAIQLVFDVDCWIFESPVFPGLEIYGDTEQEVIALYREFLQEWLTDLEKRRVAPHIAEKQWRGIRNNTGRKPLDRHIH